jgi:hypothetical protein
VRASRAKSGVGRIGMGEERRREEGRKRKRKRKE